ncbi:MAG TPA: hypothetical protein DIT35_07965 [Rhodospirillaceae bacterium]|nr:hypothetical protein [Rhodospirillaceae bacterium]
MTNMKRLILLRHAAANGAENGLNDRDRALTDIGYAEAGQQAKWLTAHSLIPQYALVSAALRARQTWGVMRERLLSPPHEYQDALYLAEPGTLLEHVGSLPEQIETAILVAHNPGIEVLSRMLAGDAPNVDAMRDMARGYPTAGIAHFDIETETWEQIAISGVRLSGFARPYNEDD